MDLLGSEILSYSLKEVVFITSTGVSEPANGFLLIPLLAALLFLYWKLNKVNIQTPRIITSVSSFIFLTLFLVGLSQIDYINPRKKDFDSRLNYQYSHNPIPYLVNQIVTLIQSRKPINPTQLKNAVAQYQKTRNQFNYKDAKFPFLRDYESSNLAISV
jgi:hypothetical protein